MAEDLARLHLSRSTFVSVRSHGEAETQQSLGGKLKKPAKKSKPNLKLKVLDVKSEADTAVIKAFSPFYTDAKL